MGAWNEVLGGTETALNSTGGATERMAIYTESLEGKLNTLQATWEEFVLNLKASDAFKIAVDLVTKLISVLDLLLNKIPILSTLIKTALVAGALNVLAGTVRQLINLMGGSLVGSLVSLQSVLGTARTGFNLLTTGVSAGANAFTATGSVVAGLSEGFGAMATAAGLSSTAIAGITAALGPLAIVAAVVAGVGIVAWFNSAKKAAKDAETAISDYQKQQEKLQSAENELQTIDDKIAEINAKDGLTLTDKQELKNLQEQRVEVEALTASYKELAKAASEQAAEAQRKAFSKQYGTSKGGILGFGSMDINTGTARDFSGKSEADLRTAASDFQLSGDLDTAVGLFKQYTELQKEARQNGQELSAQSQKDFGEISSSLQTTLSDLESQKSTLESLGDTTSVEYQRINSLIDMILQATAPEEWQNRELSKLLLGDEGAVATRLENLKNQIKSITDDESLSPEAAQVKTQQLLQAAAQELANNQEVRDALNNIFGEGGWDVDSLANTLAEQLGVAFDQATEDTTVDLSKVNFSGLDSSVDEVVNNIKDNIASIGDVAIDPTNITNIGAAFDSIMGSINGAETELNNLNGQYEALSANAQASADMLDWVNANMEALTGQTTLTGDELQKLVDSAGELGPVINTSTGQAYSAMDLLNQTVLNTGASASDMQGSVQSFMGGVQTAGNNTITTMNSVIEAINKVKQALATALNAAASFVDKVSGIASGIASSIPGAKMLSQMSEKVGFNLNLAEGAAKGLSGMADKLRSQASAITSSITSDQAQMIEQTDLLQNKITSAGNAAKATYDKVGAAAKKSGSSGTKAAKDQTDAVKELTDALKEEYEAQKAILDAQKEQLQARKEALAQEKSDLADAKDAIEDLIDMTMKMLKQEYQDQLDELDKQVDALDEQEKLFEKKVDAQKELLKLQKEEREHTEELAEKNQAIADVQAQLEELRYDNSAEAQKKRLELLDDLNSAQKDLTDYQNDYDYDTKMDELDKEKDAFQQQIDQQKQAIEDQKEYIKTVLMDEYNLYLEAINLIQGRSQELYDRLVNWNRVEHRHE